LNDPEKLGPEIGLPSPLRLIRTAVLLAGIATGQYRIVVGETGHPQAEREAPDTGEQMGRAESGRDDIRRIDIPNIPAIDAAARKLPRTDMPSQDTASISIDVIVIDGSGIMRHSRRPLRYQSFSTRLCFSLPCPEWFGMLYWTELQSSNIVSYIGQE
jgi:hypothetical protein